MCRIPRGQGAVVALKAMIDALGTFALNLYFGGVAVLNKKFCNASPNLPNESSAKGSRIMLFSHHCVWSFAW